MLDEMMGVDELIGLLVKNESGLKVPSSIQVMKWIEPVPHSSETEIAERMCPFAIRANEV